MKTKIIAIVILVIVLIGLATFIIINNQKVVMDASKLNNEIQNLQNNQVNEGANMKTNQIDNNETNTINDNTSNQTEITRVKMTINNQELYITLNDSNSSKDFIKMLPLTVQFEDYNNTEKVASLPNKLSTQDSPDGYTPEVGDFAYYAPWGNLSLFYKEFRYSNSLIKLGTLESGIENISNLSGNFSVRFELAK